MKNNKYLEAITALLKQAKPRLAETHRVEFKNCFGAVAGYVNGGIFMSLGKFGVALRLPPKSLAALFKEPDVKRLKYFPNGHVKKEYAVLPRRIMEETRRFKRLLDISIEHCSSK